MSRWGVSQYTGIEDNPDIKINEDRYPVQKDSLHKNVDLHISYSNSYLFIDNNNIIIMNLLLSMIIM